MIKDLYVNGTEQYAKALVLKVLGAAALFIC